MLQLHLFLNSELDGAGLNVYCLEKSVSPNGDPNPHQRGAIRGKRDCERKAEVKNKINLSLLSMYHALIPKSIYLSLCFIILFHEKHSAKQCYFFPNDLSPRNCVLYISRINRSLHFDATGGILISRKMDHMQSVSMFIDRSQ